MTPQQFLDFTAKPGEVSVGSGQWPSVANAVRYFEDAYQRARRRRQDTRHIHTPGHRPADQSHD